MKISTVIADTWKMDGGVCFGVVPKTLWRKHYPEAGDNLVNVVSRCLVVETEERVFLVDAGMGRKQTAKYYGYKYLSPEDELLQNLSRLGYKPEDITDVLLTHLHDDHVGGASRLNESGEPELLFPNARYWVSLNQWQWARNPNKREQAAFLEKNLTPLAESGRLYLVEEDRELAEGFFVKHFSGHTSGMLVPYINYKNRFLVFVSDLIPLTGNLPVVYLASVDIQPLVAMEEKEKFLEEAVKNAYVLVFEHDYYTECATLKRTNKGYALNETFTLQELG
ncbi:MAG: MBL fold metallo-hydrolase [Bacteroidales bacterium]|nr:MBL fold metallo-hydrolase [Bacteroidales bacterium]MCF8336561.1 MBL fold metallo-hydrolase [Bacteroidales bacterium]